MQILCFESLVNISNSILCPQYAILEKTTISEVWGLAKVKRLPNGKEQDVAVTNSKLSYISILLADLLHMNFYVLQLELRGQYFMIRSVY